MPVPWTKAKNVGHFDYPFLDTNSRVARNIEVRASRLARTGNLPSFSAEDIRQDLLAHLIKRNPTFDPKRASYDTFADRVMASRVCTLAGYSLKLMGDRAGIDFGSPLISGTDNVEWITLVETLGEDQALYGARHRKPEDAHNLIIDVHRLITSLPPKARAVAVAGLDMDLQDIPRALSLHRSTVHHHLSLIRKRAQEFGLEEYFAMRPTIHEVDRYVATGEKIGKPSPTVPGLWGNKIPGGNTPTASSTAAQGPARARLKRQRASVDANLIARPELRCQSANREKE